MKGLSPLTGLRSALGTPPWTYGVVLRGTRRIEQRNRVMFLRYLGHKGFQGVTIVGDSFARQSGRL